MVSGMGKTLTKAVLVLYGMDEDGNSDGQGTSGRARPPGNINAVTKSKLNPSGMLKGKPQSGGSKKTEIEVHYNPPSIKYSGQSGGHNVLKQQDMESIYNVAASGTIKTSFTLMLHAASAKDISVQKKMELVMRFIQVSTKREVLFKWGEQLSMGGELIAFSGSFDMFSSSGLPLSGKMEITIQTSIPAKELKNIFG